MLLITSFDRLRSFRLYCHSETVSGFNWYCLVVFEVPVAMFNLIGNFV